MVLKTCISHVQDIKEISSFKKITQQLPSFSLPDLNAKSYYLLGREVTQESGWKTDFVWVSAVRELILKFNTGRGRVQHQGCITPCTSTDATSPEKAVCSETGLWDQRVTEKLHQYVKHVAIPCTAALELAGANQLSLIMVGREGERAENSSMPLANAASYRQNIPQERDPYYFY